MKMSCFIKPITGASGSIPLETLIYCEGPLIAHQDCPFYHFKSCLQGHQSLAP
jgi:hypothetical protein